MSRNEKHGDMHKDAHEELNRERQKLRRLHGRARLQYIWDYYKLPILFLCVVIYIAGYMVYSHVTEKTTVLSVALVNVAPGEELTEELSNGFLDAVKRNPKKNEVRLYPNLYLTQNEDDPNHEYTYASRMKILGAIDDEALDVVWMNEEAFDAFSQSGYLYNLETLLSRSDEELYRKLSPYLTENSVFSNSDTSGAATGNTAAADTYPTGLSLSKCPYVEKTGLNGTVYLGVIANSPHLDEAVSYIDYLFRDMPVSD